MDKFFILENSSSNNTTFQKEELNDEEFITRVINKINYDYDFINDIVNNIIDNSFYNLSGIDIKKEREGNKFIDKILDKFSIKKNIRSEDPIDLVYTFINYRDKGYQNSKMKFENEEIDSLLLKNFRESSNEYYRDFFLNVEMTKKNLPFTRNIFIITPTPIYFEEINKYIIIPIKDICGKDKFNTIYFRPNKIVKYLTELKGLSNLFLFGTQDTAIVTPFNRKDFVKNIPEI